MSYTGISEVYTTVQGGLWSNAATWENGIVPDYENDDELVFNHGVVITSDLIINSGGSIYISETGGICGHYELTMNNSSLDSEGYINLDALNLASSHAEISGGELILTEVAHLYSSSEGGPGGLSISGGGMAVGPWFDCYHPVFDTSISDFEEVPSRYSFFPNPVIGLLKISFEAAQSSHGLIEIIDMTGEKVFTFELAAGSKEKEIDLSSLTKGLYLLSITSDNKVQSELLQVY